MQTLVSYTKLIAGAQKQPSNTHQNAKVLPSKVDYKIGSYISKTIKKVVIVIAQAWKLLNIFNSPRFRPVLNYVCLDWVHLHMAIPYYMPKVLHVVSTKGVLFLSCI